MAPVTEKTRTPTKKWFANAIPVMFGWLIALAQNGWDLTTELQVSGLGILAGLLASYFLANEATPGGVPRRRKR